METNEIWARLTSLLSEVLGADSLELTPDTTAADVEGWDSVTHVEILVAIEQAFGVRFRTGELSGLRNVGELVDRLARDAG